MSADTRSYRGLEARKHAFLGAVGSGMRFYRGEGTVIRVYWGLGAQVRVFTVGGVVFTTSYADKNYV